MFHPDKDKSEGSFSSVFLAPVNALCVVIPEVINATIFDAILMHYDGRIWLKWSLAMSVIRRMCFLTEGTFLTPLKTPSGRGGCIQEHDSANYFVINEKKKDISI